MKPLKKAFIVLLLPLLAFTTVHKFYVSVTNINYSEKDDAFQITTRIFIDDLDEVLKERYDVKAMLATDKESPLAEEYVEKYLRAKFLLKINGTAKQFDYIGKKYDNDVVICYMEIPKVLYSQLKSVEVQNEILHDLYEEQQNVVHFKFDKKKKSFVLIRENNKGMLNF